MGTSGIDIIIAVWGPEFIGPFLNASLPSMLSPGNLPSVAQKAKLRMQIFTSTDGCDQMKPSNIVQKAARYAEVNFYSVGTSDEIARQHKYFLHTQIFERAIEFARDAAANFMILAPDFIVSDGTLLNLHDSLANRPGILLFPSIRVKKFSFLSTLLTTYGSEVTSRQSLTISGRELATLGLQHLHPLVQSAFVSVAGEGQFFCRPPIFYWPIGGTGLLVRSMVLSPIFVKPRRWPRNLTPTLDFQDFPTACGIGRHEIKAAADSDEMLMLEFSSYNADFYQVEKKHATVDGVIDWIGRIGMPHHLEYLRYTYLMRAGNVDDLSAQHNADKLMATILDQTLPLVKFQLAPKLCAMLRERATHVTLGNFEFCVSG